MMLFGASFVPPVISTGANDKAISICEAYVCQVSRMAQKALVFGLRTDHIHHPGAVFHTTVIRFIKCQVGLLLGTVMKCHRQIHIYSILQCYTVKYQGK